MNPRRQALQSRRAELDLAIDREMKRPAPDSLTLQRLKKKSWPRRTSFRKPVQRPAFYCCGLERLIVLRATVQ